MKYQNLLDRFITYVKVNLHVQTKILQPLKYPITS